MGDQRCRESKEKAKIEGYMSVSDEEAHHRVEQLLARIRSGENLDEIAFAEGNITFWQLRNIDHTANPKFYTESSQHMDNNYQQPCLEDFDSQEEEEGAEEIPLSIPGPLGTHTRNLHSEHSSG